MKCTEEDEYREFAPGRKIQHNHVGSPCAGAGGTGAHTLLDVVDAVSDATPRAE